MTCDCGTDRMKSFGGCNLRKNFAHLDEACDTNTYNHNFQGRFCFCDKPYNEETDIMYQCLMPGCGEDWYHDVCIGVPTNKKMHLEGVNVFDQLTEVEQHEEVLPDDHEFVCYKCVESEPRLKVIWDLPGVVKMRLEPKEPKNLESHLEPEAKSAATSSEANTESVEDKSGASRTSDTSNATSNVKSDASGPSDATGATSRTSDATKSTETESGASNVKTEAVDVTPDSTTSEPTDVMTEAVKTEADDVTVDSTATDSKAETTTAESKADTSSARAATTSGEPTKEPSSTTKVTFDNSDKSPNSSTSQNGLKRTLDTSSTHPTRSPPSTPYNMFLSSNFRKIVHDSKDPTIFGLTLSFPFLAEEEQVYEPPSDDDAGSSLLDAGTSALHKMPRQQAIDGMAAYNQIKDKLSAFFKPFAEGGKVVTDRDVTGFFEEMKRKQA